MPTDTVENYLKTVHDLAEASPSGEATVGEIARALGVTSGTVTSMLKRLRNQRLCRHERYGGVSLTAKGVRLARAVLRRHRLVETFLVRILGCDWSQVHEDAEHLEHAISERLLERFDKFLGHPAFDPHGDPIPDADGKIREAKFLPLSDCSRGTRAVVARVLNQNEQFLRFVEINGLKPGDEIVVESVDTHGGTISVLPAGGKRISLSMSVAEVILLRRR